MSIRITRRPPLRGYNRNSRRCETVREVDLNVPPTENRDKYGTSAHAYSHVVEPPAPIDVDTSMLLLVLLNNFIYDICNFKAPLLFLLTFY